MMRKGKILYSTVVFEKNLLSWQNEISNGNIPTVDLSLIDFFDVGALTYLMAFAYSAVSSKYKSVKISGIPIILPITKQSIEFLYKMKFFNFASNEEVFIGANDLARIENTKYPISDIRKMSTSRFPFLPFRRVVVKTKHFLDEEAFETECQQFILYVDNFFHVFCKANKGLSINISRRILKPIKEVYENIYYHSGSWGFSLIQTNNKGIDICFADIGVGVMQSLLEVYKPIVENEGKQWNDENAIIYAFKRSVTRTPGKSQGNGLDILKTRVIELGGAFEFRSGCAKLICASDGRQNIINVGYIPGVQVKISIPLRRLYGDSRGKSS